MKILLLILSGLVVFLLNSNYVLAGPATFSLDEENFHLQTSAGKPLRELVSVKNLSSEILVLKLNWRPSSLTQHSIDFASVSPSNLEIQPFGIGTVETFFETPENLKPGDYYGRLEIKNAGEERQIEFRLRLLGELKEEVELKEFDLNKENFHLKFENNGNISSLVKSQLTITDFFGRKLLSQNIDQFEIKAQDNNTISLAANLKVPGPYQAKIVTTFGTKETPQSALRSFWVKPNFFWAGIVFLTILLSGSIFYRLFLRQRNV